MLFCNSKWENGIKWSEFDKKNGNIVKWSVFWVSRSLVVTFEFQGAKLDQNRIVGNVAKNKPFIFFQVQLLNSWHYFILVFMSFSSSFFFFGKMIFAYFLAVQEMARIMRRCKENKNRVVLSTYLFLFFTYFFNIWSSNWMN